MEDAAPLELVSCSSCGRNFSTEVIARHSKICTKVNKPRKVFDSSKQRHVADEQIIKKLPSYSKSSTTKPRNPEREIKQPKSNWKQKHDDFIRTVRAAREATIAVKQGKPLPPPPPAAINPDYIQCPHCARRFNENAADRHIKFCAEQKKRIPTKTANHQKADAAMKTRIKYKPPPLKTKSAVTAVRSHRSDSGENNYELSTHRYGSRTSLPSSRYNNGHQNRLNPPTPSSGQQRSPTSGQRRNLSNGQQRNPSNGQQRSTRRAKPPPAEWDNSVDSFENSHPTRTKTGLKPANSTSRISREASAGKVKPPSVRKIAHRSSPKQEDDRDRPQPYYSDVKRRQYGHETMRETPQYGSRDDNGYTPSAYGGGGTRGYESNNYRNNTSSPGAMRNNDSNNYKTNNNSSAGAMRNNKQVIRANYCQECGSKFPVVNAKFCCECGMRRFSLDG